jgi:hypothetical protein
MGIPKRKTSIEIYKNKEVSQGSKILERRQELLDNITKSDSFLPDSVLHDDLDRGMLDYISEHFKVISDGKQIPIIEKILTIQRWGEFTNNWSFSDDDGNVKLPFIAVIRKPEVQFGTNPAMQRTIPERYQVYYATVPTWNGNQMGADVYKIPQPIPCDITYEVTMVCTKFRELNKLNKIVLQKFTSRQAYTTVKGHYIPILLEGVEDNTPMDTLDGRRFYMQTYKFTMLGFLIDSDEFEVKPAITRQFTMSEFLGSAKFSKKVINPTLNIITSTIIADGNSTFYTIGETIGILFNVAINGILQEKDVNFLHMSGTSRITFLGTPLEGDVITITYYKGKSNIILDSFQNPLTVAREYIQYTGGTLYFTLEHNINTLISISTNGVLEIEESSYTITDRNIVMLNGTPVNGAFIEFLYIH